MTWVFVSIAGLVVAVMLIVVLARRATERDARGNSVAEVAPSGPRSDGSSAAGRR